MLLVGALTISACGDKDIKKEIEGKKIEEIHKQSDVSAISSEKEVYQEGVHYRMVTNIDVDLESPYIVEYFWLGCPHCQKIEPFIKGFLKSNKEVKLVRRHAALQERWGLDARVYYALENMNKMELFDDLFELYTSMSIDGKVPSKEDLDSFLEDNAVDVVTFFNIADSDEVLEKIKLSASEMHVNKMSGVPSLVINGKYLATPNEDIKNYDDYMKLVSFLIKK